MTETGPSSVTPEITNWAPAPQLARPTLQPERISSIDALRGVAVLGILLLNIQFFAMPGAAYFNPTAYGDLNGPNWWVWFVCHVLADQKFMTIFSMLFGAGIVLMTSAHEKRSGGSAGLHYRRMGWLILFGILHSYLLWIGDILYTYGMCGLAAWLFRKMRPGWLMMLGVSLLVIGSSISLLEGQAFQMMDEDAKQPMYQEFNPTQDDLKPELDAYRGSWSEQMWERVPNSLFFQTLVFATWGIWRAGGLILVGMALFKWGVFSAQRSRRWYLTMLAIGLCIGPPLSMYGVHRVIQEGWDGIYLFFTGTQYNYWGSLFTSMAWVSLVMLMWKSGLDRTILKPFAAVGQMALTNYLMQTIICTTIFYGHGFGLFGEFERTEQLMVVVGVWIVQLIWSPLWLSKFRFGPFEWLWRSLTYLKPQPMLR